VCYLRDKCCKNVLDFVLYMPIGGNIKDFEKIKNAIQGAEVENKKGKN